jgi:hypothetical protein
LFDELCVLALKSFVLEILIQRVKQLQPEEIARKIQDFDQDLCTEVFLGELKPVLPSPEQVFHRSLSLKNTQAYMVTGRKTQRIPQFERTRIG